MKIAYLDCVGGVSGDMLLGALVDSGLDIDLLRKELKKLDLVDWRISTRKVNKSDIAAMKIDVIASGKPRERTLSDIEKIINQSSLAPPIKKKSFDVFRLLAEAEAQIHGETERSVHFHEVGAIDSIIDIVGTISGFSLLDLQRIYCSTLPFDKPAPATVKLAKALTVKGIDTGIETVTPTGAALVKALTKQTQAFPAMTITTSGYGAGDADTTTPNVLGIIIGETDESSYIKQDAPVTQIDTNIDDITAETLGYTMESLLEAGAQDVWFTSIQMKKNRPGTMLSVLCQEESATRLVKLIFKETGSLGLRVQRKERVVLPRNTEKITTEYGDVTIKTGVIDKNTVSSKPEYEDCAKLARKHGVPLREIYIKTYQAFYKRKT